MIHMYNYPFAEDFAEADDDSDVDSSAESDQNYLMMKTSDQKPLHLPKPVIKELMFYFLLIVSKGVDKTMVSVG